MTFTCNCTVYFATNCSFINHLIVPVECDLPSPSTHSLQGVCVLYGATADSPNLNWTWFSAGENTLPSGAVHNELIKNVIWTGIMAAPFPPITISAVLSLFYLKRAGDRAKEVNGTNSTHKSASVTVVLVTMVYLVFYTPMFIYLLRQLYFIKVYLDKMDQNSNNEISVMDYYRQLHSDDKFMKYYAWILVFEVPTVLRAALNPLVFFWRVGSFRRFVRSRKLFRSEDSTPDLVSQNSNTTRNEHEMVEKRRSSVVIEHMH